MKQVIPRLRGGIGAGEWPNMDAVAYAEVLKRTGCNHVTLEAMAPCYQDAEPYYNSKTLDQIVDEVISWVHIFQQQDLWVTLHWVNGGDDNPLDRYGLEAHKNALRKLMLTCGTTSVIIVPVAEYHGNGPEEQWAQFCLESWGKVGGHLAYNDRGRPAGLHVGYTLMDYHSHRRDEVPSGPSYLIDTDSPVVRDLQDSSVPKGYGNPAKVGEMARLAFARGAHFNFYMYDSDKVDIASLSAIGQAYGAVPVEPPIDPPVEDDSILDPRGQYVEVSGHIETAAGLLSDRAKMATLSGVIQVHSVTVSADGTQLKIKHSGNVTVFLGGTAADPFSNRLKVYTLKWVDRRDECKCMPRAGGGYTVTGVIAQPDARMIYDMSIITADDATSAGKVMISEIEAAFNIDTAGLQAFLLDDIVVRVSKDNGRE